MTDLSSPMVALMRECINTPCRGSDLGAHDLITVVRQDDLYDSPIPGPRPPAPTSVLRRTAAPRSAKSKTVSFHQDSFESPSKSARARRRQSARQTPRKPLSDLPIIENRTPLNTHSGGSSEKVTESSRRRTHESKRVTSTQNSAETSLRETALEMQVQELKEEVEERDWKIDQLTKLVKFLSAEVRIYTASLQSQLDAQTDEVERLKGTSK